jgi:hypothetical protein
MILIYWAIVCTHTHTHTIKENRETLLGARRDVGLQNKCREDKVYDHVSSSEFKTEQEEDT